MHTWRRMNGYYKRGKDVRNGPLLREKPEDLAKKMERENVFDCDGWMV